MSKIPPQDDSRPVPELVAIALGDPDEQEAWDAVSALHWRGTKEVLLAAQNLCRSSCRREREVGCDILGQVGVPERTFPAECVKTLLEVLGSETDETVLRSILVAFSHLGEERGATGALGYAQHPDPEVRRAVVLAAASFESEVTIAALLTMSNDEDARVRDWATFSLAQQIDADTPAIREALAARLSDADPDTRGEALIGLAIRGDTRAVNAIAEAPAAFTGTDHAASAKSILKEKGLL